MSVQLDALDELYDHLEKEMKNSSMVGFISYFEYYFIIHLFLSKGTPTITCIFILPMCLVKYTYQYFYSIENKMPLNRSN